MTTRLDTFIPDYALNVPVTNGVPWYGPIFPLYNAVGVAIYVSTSQGAAGSVLASPTNGVGNAAYYTVNNNTYPAGSQTAGGTVTANNSSALTFLNTNPGIMYHSMYVSFTPTASGVLNISINIRRFGA